MGRPRAARRGARPRRARPRLRQAARVRHGAAAPHPRPPHRGADDRAASRACAPRCSSGSTSCCSSTASRRTRRSPRRSSSPSRARATASSTRSCAASSARAPSCPRTRRPRGPPCATRTRSGSSGSGGTCSGPTRRARCSPPTTSPPSSRCASTRSSRHDLSDIPGRSEGHTIIVDGPFDALAHPGYAAGAFTPQSRASQLVAPLLDPRPGERVLDLCAAPGGKTTHVAALMGDEGEIVAVEKHPGRARALEVTARRMHASSVRVVVGDATTFRDDDGVRPGPARPAVQRRSGRCARTPTCASG